MYLNSANLTKKVTCIVFLYDSYDIIYIELLFIITTSNLISVAMTPLLTYCLFVHHRLPLHLYPSFLFPLSPLFHVLVLGSRLYNFTSVSESVTVGRLANPEYKLWIWSVGSLVSGSGIWGELYISEPSSYFNLNIFSIYDAS